MAPSGLPSDLSASLASVPVKESLNQVFSFTSSIFFLISQILSHVFFIFLRMNIVSSNEFIRVTERREKFSFN